MPYLIDGHNLIPKLGLRLDSPDDELELTAILQEFSRLSRHAAEVYFDGAPTGQARIARAEVTSSGEFSVLLKKGQQPTSKLAGERELSLEEVNEWLKSFGRQN